MDNNDTVMNIFRYCLMFWILLMLPSIMVVWFCVTYEMVCEFIAERKYIKRKKNESYERKSN
jgi:hypothetical protein